MAVPEDPPPQLVLDADKALEMLDRGMEVKVEISPDLPLNMAGAVQESLKNLLPFIILNKANWDLLHDKVGGYWEASSALEERRTRASALEDQLLALKQEIRALEDQLLALKQEIRSLEDIV